MTDISNFSKFSDNIKKTIKYIYLQENNLKSIESLSTFSNLYEVVVCGNPNLTSLSGLENHTTVSYLISQYSGISTLSGLNGCSNVSNIIINNNQLMDLNGLASNELTVLYCPYNKLESIANITNCPNLTHINLENNTDNSGYSYYLSDISPLVNCARMVKCYLEGNTKLDEDVLAMNEFKSLLKRCGSDYSLNKKYALLFLDGAKQDFLNYGLTDNQLKLLKGNENIKGIRLQGNSELTNQVINEVLESLPNLEYANLKGLSQLTDVSFIKSTNKKLKGLNLWGTSVTDLSSLENWVVSFEGKSDQFPLATLIIDNEDIDLTGIQKLINNISSKGINTYSSCNIDDMVYRGIVIESSKLCEKLSDCTEIENLVCYAGNTSYLGIVDLTGCEGKLKSVLLRKSGYTVKLPSSCTSLTLDSEYCGADLSESKDIETVNLGWWIATDIDKDLFIKQLAENNKKIKSIAAERCSVMRGEIRNLDLLNSTNKVSLNFSNSGVTKLIFTKEVNCIDNIKLISCGTFSSLEGFEFLTGLSYLDITGNIVNRLSPLTNIVTLGTINANNNKLNSLEGVQNLVNLTTLNVAGNSISDLYWLGKLVENDKIKLTSLDLSDNLIENNITVSIDTDGNGNKESIFVDNLKIIEDLWNKGCKNINLKNNGSLDTNRLSKLTGVQY